MKKITLSAVALVLASLVFVLSGCEMSLKSKDKNTEDTQSHTAIVEVTDENGEVVATETVTISQDELKKGEVFFNKEASGEKIETGVSADRLQQAISANADSSAVSQNSNQSPSQSSGTLSGSSSSGGSVQTTSGSSGSQTYVQDDAAVLKSTQYMITGRAVYEGSATPYKVARSGEKLAMFAELNGQQIGIIVTEDKVYMLSVDEKTYIEITKDMLKENLSEEELAQFSGSALSTNRTVQKTENQAEDGVTYKVVIYDDGVKDYFIGNTIIKTVSSDGSVLYYDSVSAVAPASVFAPPSDYKRTTLDEEGVSDFIGSVEGADHTHSADE